MGDMGLQGAYGAQGAADALRQLIKDRLERQQQAFTNDRLTAQDARVAEEHAAKMQDYRDSLAQRAQGERDTAAGKALPNIGIGGAVEAPDYTKTFAGTSSAPLFTPERTLPSTQVAGGMPLDPSQPSVQNTRKAPRQITGRMLSMGTDAQRTGEEQKVLRGRLMSNPNLSDLQRTAIEAESAGLKVPSNVFEPKAPTHLVQAVKDGKPTYVPEGDAAGMTPYHPPTQSPDQKLVKVEHKDPATGRTVIEWLPQGDLRGKTFQKGAGAAAEGRLASAEAVNQTGDDIIQQMSNPKVAQNLGPALGRYSRLSDFIGNPPPEYAELAGQIESYALASMGVHGMRSAAGAEKIKAMLDAHHTPESLAASIRGLSKFSQHFMQNEGRGQPQAPSGGGGGSAPSGGGPISVTAPDGSVHPFSTQAQADAFKQLAGMK